MADALPETPRAASGRARAAVAAALFVGLLSAGGWWAGRDLAARTSAQRAPLGGARLFDQVIGINSVVVQRCRTLPAHGGFARAHEADERKVVDLARAGHGGSLGQMAVERRLILAK